MLEVSDFCVLLKNLPFDSCQETVLSCLQQRTGESACSKVLKVESRIERKNDKRWIVLFPASEAAAACIKHGPWQAETLEHGSVTVTPDYCSECIIPDDWEELLPMAGAMPDRAPASTDEEDNLDYSNDFTIVENSGADDAPIGGQRSLSKTEHDSHKSTDKNRRGRKHRFIEAPESKKGKSKNTMPSQIGANKSGSVSEEDKFLKETETVCDSFVLIHTDSDRNDKDSFQSDKLSLSDSEPRSAGLFDYFSIVNAEETTDRKEKEPSLVMDASLDHHQRLEEHKKFLRQHSADSSLETIYNRQGTVTEKQTAYPDVQKLAKGGQTPGTSTSISSVVKTKPVQGELHPGQDGDDEDNTQTQGLAGSGLASGSELKQASQKLPGQEMMEAKSGSCCPNVVSTYKSSIAGEATLRTERKMETSHQTIDSQTVQPGVESQLQQQNLNPCLDSLQAPSINQYHIESEQNRPAQMSAALSNEPQSTPGHPSTALATGFQQPYNTPWPNYQPSADQMSVQSQGQPPLPFPMNYNQMFDPNQAWMQMACPPGYPVPGYPPWVPPVPMGYPPVPEQLDTRVNEPDDHSLTEGPSEVSASRKDEISTSTCSEPQLTIPKSPTSPVRKPDPYGVGTNDIVKDLGDAKTGTDDIEDEDLTKPGTSSHLDHTSGQLEGYQGLNSAEPSPVLQTPVSVDESKAIQEEDVVTQSHVTVKRLSSDTTKYTLELFFENSRRSGGGEIESIEMKSDPLEAVITFKDSAVAERVVEKQKSKAFVLDGATLQVDVYVPPPLEDKRLFLSGITPKASRDNLIFYLERRCQEISAENEVDDVMYGEIPGTAIVTFEKPLTKMNDLASRCCQVKLEDDACPKLEALYSTPCVLVKDLDKTTTAEMLSLYFENKGRSCGGDVDKVKLNSRNCTALVFFCDYKDAYNVSSKSGHVFSGQALEVTLYYECLGMPAVDIPTPDQEDENKDDSQSEEKLQPSPVDLKEIDGFLVQFFRKSVYKQKFEEDMAKIGGFVTWPEVRGGAFIISSIVTEGKEHKFPEDWESLIRTEAKQFTRGFTVDEVSVPQEIWKEMTEELGKVEIKCPEGVGVFLVKDEERIVISGISKLVADLKPKIENIYTNLKDKLEKNDEVFALKKQIKTYQMTLLKASRFKQEAEATFEGVEVLLGPDPGQKREVVLKGTEKGVHAALARMWESINSFASKQFLLTKPAKDLLFVPETRVYIKKMLRRQKLIGVWDVTRGQDKVDMYARSEEDVQKAINIIQKHLIEKRLEVDPSSLHICESQEWKTMVENLKTEYKDKLSITDDANGILLVCTDDVFEDVWSELQKYVELHIIHKEFVPLDRGVIRFLKEFKQTELKSLADQYKKLVEITAEEDFSRTGFKLEGNKDGCKLAMKGINSLVEGVKQHVYPIKAKPGMKQFFRSDGGKAKIKEVEKWVNCVIELDLPGMKPGDDYVSPGGATGHGSVDVDEGSDGEDTDEGNSDREDVMSDEENTETDGIKVNVIKGELAKQKADVIVNSTSPTLKLDVGLTSKSLLTAGGIALQGELLKKYPDGIPAGSVAATSGGNLYCNKLYHGWLKPWDLGQGESLQIMEGFVMNCLKAADAHGFSSLAFPALGTGKLGFPPERVGKLMFDCVHYYQKNVLSTGITRVDFVVYSKDETTAKAFIAAKPRSSRVLSSKKGRAAQKVKIERFAGKTSGTDNFRDQKEEDILVLIYCDSKATFLQAKEKLDGHLKYEVQDTGIYGAEIKKLTRQEIAKITRMCKKHGVVVNVYTSYGKVKLEGLRKYVSEVKTEIESYLSHVKQKQEDDSS